MTERNTKFPENDSWNSIEYFDWMNEYCFDVLPTIMTNYCFCLATNEIIAACLYEQCRIMEAMEPQSRATDFAWMVAGPKIMLVQFEHELLEYRL